MSAPTEHPAFDEEALPQLDFLYRYALRLTRDRATAEDLVQETMLRAFRAWHQFRPGSNARAWLATILRNAHVNELRRMRRRVTGLEDAQLERLATSENEAQMDPEGTYFEQLVDDEVLAAINALPEEFRETLVLSDVEDLPYADVAAIVGAPIGTVKSRIFRARRMLQRRLRRYAQEMGYVPATP
jgi:RNA polymerase sigma-70 factor (ECF subfamily)